MPGKKERQTFDSGQAAPEVQPGPTTVPELPESNSDAQEQTRGIGGIRESRPLAETPTLDAANADLEALSATPSGAGGTGSATVAFSAGGKEAAGEEGSGGAYTQALLRAKKENPERSIDELATQMADFEVHGKAQHADVVKVGRSNAEAGHKKVGVVVSNSDYERLPDLPGAKADAQGMMGAYGGEFDLVLHEDLRKGGIAGAAAQGMQGLAAGDHMVFYYAGHGIPEGLLGVDARPSDVKSAVFPRGAVLGLVNRARTQGFHLTAILDSCHSGAVGQAVSDLRLVEMEKDENLSADARKLVAIAKRLQGIQGKLGGRTENPDVKRKSAKSSATANPGSAGGGTTTRGSMPLSPAPGETRPDPRFKEVEACANDYQAQTGSDALTKTMTTETAWSRMDIGWRRDAVGRMIAIVLEHVENA